MYIVVSKPMEQPAMTEVKLIVKDNRASWIVERGAGAHINLWWTFLARMFTNYNGLFPSRVRSWNVSGHDRELHAAQFETIDLEFRRFAILFTNQYYEYTIKHWFTFTSHEEARAQMRPNCAGCTLAGAWTRAVGDNGRVRQLFTCPTDCDGFRGLIKRHVQLSGKFDEEKLNEAWTLTTGLQTGSWEPLAPGERPWLAPRPSQESIRLQRQDPLRGLIPI